jgi:hypothetical protein
VAHSPWLAPTRQRWLIAQIEHFGKRLITASSPQTANNPNRPAAKAFAPSSALPADDLAPIIAFVTSINQNF